MSAAVPRAVGPLERAPGVRAPTGRAPTDVAAHVWRARAVAELEAAARFDRLATELREVGAVTPVVDMARAAAEDERRHATLCRRLARHFGGPALVEIAPPPPRPVGPRGLGQRERVLFEVVAMGCVTETLSAAILGGLVERASDPEARAVMLEILRDEVRHARLGWAHLAAERARGVGDVISSHLPAMLEATVNDALLAAPATKDATDPDAAALAGLGSLPIGVRRHLFEETLCHVIFPGLEHVGIDTRGARGWLDEATAPPQPAAP
jgi:hypothetical protein